MKKFIKHLLLFSVIALTMYSAIIVFNYYLINSEPLAAPQSKNILILGDSNSQTAINDSIYRQSLNLSGSADPYLYSYLKLKKIINSNSHIDTLLLSFSPQNIFKNNWTFNTEHLYSRFQVYYPFMESEDILMLFKGNPKGVISASSAIMRHTFTNCIERVLDQNSIHNYGNFLRLDRNILEEVKEKLKNDEPLPFFELPKTLDVAENEVRYLYKIIELCKSQNLKIYLVNMPKRHELLEHSKYGVNTFYDYYDNNLSDIPFLDFSRLNMPDDYYGDLVHLNIKGSDYFSTILKNQGLQNLARAYAR